MKSVNCNLNFLTRLSHEIFDTPVNLNVMPCTRNGSERQRMSLPRRCALEASCSLPRKIM
jgi:hypothetical protein